MKKRLLAGKKIFEIGLGAMALDEYDPKPSDDDAHELLKFGVNKGIELIDTADVYGLGRNEKLIGESLSNEYKNIVNIATKCGCTRPDGKGWDTNGDPAHIKEAIHKSLDRLGLKKIWLYQLHAPDHRIPYIDSINAMKELQDNGLVEHIGISNVTLDQIKTAQKIVKIVSVQNHFNLGFKKDEQELLPYLTENNISFLPYFPLGGGRLLQNRTLLDIAKNIGNKPNQLALSWILTKWPTAIPIPGTKNKNHLDENINASDIDLDEKIIEKLNNLF